MSAPLKSAKVSAGSQSYSNMPMTTEETFENGAELGIFSILDNIFHKLMNNELPSDDTFLEKVDTLIGARTQQTKSYDSSDDSCQKDSDGKVDP